MTWKADLMPFLFLRGSEYGSRTKRTLQWKQTIWRVIRQFLQIACRHRILGENTPCSNFYGTDDFPTWRTAALCHILYRNCFKKLIQNIPHSHILVDYKHGNKNILDARHLPCSWENAHGQSLCDILHMSCRKEIYFTLKSS
jgi:hypothetical protein